MARISLLFSLIFIGFQSPAHAQYDDWTPAKVVLINGTSIRGLVKLPRHSGNLISLSSSDFKFRKKRKSLTQKLGHKTVVEVVFGDEQFSTLRYKYVPIKPKKYALLEVISEGAVSLYSRDSGTYRATSHRTVILGPEGSNSPMSVHPGYSYVHDDTQYYVKRKNEKSAKLIAGPNNFKSFITKAKTYFSDCEKIVYYLDNDLYNIDNITELVDDYNLLCN
jgi:hypothetical protein